jgi:cytochrome c-type biogenesis protein CcmE
VLTLAFAYLLLTSLSSTTVYYLTVGELKAKGAQAAGQAVRVAGTVTPGTIVRDQGGLSLRFDMQDQSGSLPVTYRGGTIPDIFADEVEVVVEGKLGADGTFAATTLLAKCPSKFEDGTQMGTGGPSA